MGDTAVPMLWAGNLTETLDFYRMLGYTVAAEQTSPYSYGAVTRNGCHVHFVRGPTDSADAENHGGYCLVLVEEVADLHKTFSEALRERYGKIPARGLPRITRFRPGQTRFTVVDPAGNSIIYVRHNEPEMDHGGSRKLKGLQRVLDTARILRFSKLDDVAARKAIEGGLRRFGATAAPVDRAHALAELIELAVALGEPERATELRAQIAALNLSPEDRVAVAEHLKIATDLEEWLTETN